jgi:hypothetical protein
VIKYDLQRAKRAVQYLVDTSYFTHHLRKIRSTLVKPRALPFKDDSEVLNELLVIGRQNVQALENLIEVAEFKRDDKNEYQRKYMAAKRQRDTKVIKLEEMLQGKKLTLDERKNVLLKQYEVWEKERKAYLEAHQDMAWADRNAAIRKFWAKKEADVDELIHEAQNAQQKHKRPTKYSVVVSKPEPKTVLGQKLKRALDKPS